MTDAVTRPTSALKIGPLALVSCAAVVLGLILPINADGTRLMAHPVTGTAFMLLVPIILATELSLVRRCYGLMAMGLVGYIAAALFAFNDQHFETPVATGFWVLTIACWTTTWLFVSRLSGFDITNRPMLGRFINLIIPVCFGVTLLILWQLIVLGANVPKVLLPAPSDIGLRLVNSVPVLWADFQQTFLKAVIVGYALGCSSAFITAIIVDRVPFLRRGLLPIGNFISALPIIGVAPIMVMWFGFEWQSKAAVVIIMTFFPMLVNTVSGLAASDSMQKDLMRTYAADYWQTLIKLRLPMAMPFIFNALKINSTLALIGAIVAEFFGTPIVGMGFRISTEVGRMNVDMVWAEIAVAALAGSLFYALIAQLEKVVTFWHPSQRKG